MNKTSIPWVRNPDGTPGFTWSPVIGCKALSAGCANCWAERLAATRLDHMSAYHRLTKGGHWTGEQRFLTERLAEPLKRRKPSGIFVVDMGDLFGDGVTNEQIAAVYGVMSARPQHTFYTCTKRAKRRREWFEWVEVMAERCKEIFPDEDLDWRRIHVLRASAMRQGAGNLPGYTEMLATGWPLKNVREGTTVENQAAADERIPELLQTPAAVRFLSVEPILEEVSIKDCLNYNEQRGYLCTCPHGRIPWSRCDVCEDKMPVGSPGWLDLGINWVIVGGESGPNAHPCHVEWIRSIVSQCQEAGVSCFSKQLGANAHRQAPGHGTERIHLCARAGADPNEWPEDLRIRQFPEVSP